MTITMICSGIQLRGSDQADIRFQSETNSGQDSSLNLLVPRKGHPYTVGDKIEVTVADKP